MPHRSGRLWKSLDGNPAMVPDEPSPPFPLASYDSPCQGFPSKLAETSSPSFASSPSAKAYSPFVLSLLNLIRFMLIFGLNGLNFSDYLGRSIWFPVYLDQGWVRGTSLDRGRGMEEG